MLRRWYENGLLVKEEIDPELLAAPPVAELADTAALVGLRVTGTRSTTSKALVFCQATPEVTVVVTPAGGAVERVEDHCVA